MLLIGPLETNFSEILIEIHIFSFNKMQLKMSFGKWRPYCVGLNVLTEMPVNHDVCRSLSSIRCEFQGMIQNANTQQRISKHNAVLKSLIITENTLKDH